MTDPLTDALDAELLLDGLEARVATDMIGHALGAWSLHMGGNAHAPVWPSTLDQPRILDRLCAWRGAFHGALGDRVHVMWQLLAAARVEMDDDVRGARLASATAGVPTSALFRARNAAARRLGFDGFLAFLSAADGMGPDELAGALDTVPGALDTVPGPPDAGAGQVDPLAERLAGMSDESILALVVGCLAEQGARLAPRVQFVAGVSPRTYLVDPPGDVRVVTVPVKGRASAFRALWHELGHVLMTVGRGAPTSWALGQPRSRVVDEACAELIADCVSGDAFLVGTLGLGSAEVATVRRVRCQRRARWARRQWAWAALEAALYRDPAVERTACWRQICRSVALSDGDPARAWPSVVDDPGAQLRYHAAEQLRRQLGASPVEAALALSRASVGEWRGVARALAPEV